MVLGWPSMCGKPSSSYLSLQLGNPRPRLQQGESSTVEREWERKRKKREGGEQA